MKPPINRSTAALMRGFYISNYESQEDVTELDPQKRNVSMVFQQYALWPHMSVFDNVAYGLKLKKIDKAKIEQRVNDILRKVEIDIEDAKNRKPQQYSGGQQQRISLARSLVVQPDVLLMDEPLSNLDAKVRQKLRFEIKKIQRNTGVTTIYVTHDQEEALSMADNIIVMDKGSIEQMGTPEEIYRQPESAFVAEFLGESHPLELTINGKNQRLILRANDISVKQLDFQSSDNQVAIEGILDDVLYMGSYYRYSVIVEGQEIFADSQQKLPLKSKCQLIISKEYVLEFY